MQSICFRIRHQLALTPTSNSQKTTVGRYPFTAHIPPGIAPQHVSVGTSRNHFQTIDNLNFFHKLDLEEVDEAYHEFESTP